MGDVGVHDRALFILFGNAVTKIFRKQLGKIYRNNVKCTHYAMFGKGYCDWEWVAKTWRILEEHYRATATKFGTPEFRVTDEMTNELEKLRRRKPAQEIR